MGGSEIGYPFLLGGGGGGGFLQEDSLSIWGITRVPLFWDMPIFNSIQYVNTAINIRKSKNMNKIGNST